MSQADPLKARDAHESNEIPPAVDLLTCFETGVTRDGILPKVAFQLRCHHDEQWQAEDLSRKAADDDRVLADIKRRIDRMNVIRSGLVDELDAWLSQYLSQNPAAPLHTETLGSVVDRLCIAWVRADRLGRVGPGSRGRRAAEQLRELAHAYDLLVAEVIAGRRRVPEWQALKSYGEDR